ADYISDSLVIARGTVRCSAAANSRIISCGEIRCKEPKAVKESKLVEHEPKPLGFVTFFDTADVGLKVESADGGARVKSAEKGNAVRGGRPPRRRPHPRRQRQGREGRRKLPPSAAGQPCRRWRDGPQGAPRQQGQRTARAGAQVAPRLAQPWDRGRRMTS